MEVTDGGTSSSEEGETQCGSSHSVQQKDDVPNKFITLDKELLLHFEGMIMKIYCCQYAAIHQLKITLS